MGGDDRGGLGAASPGGLLSVEGLSARTPLRSQVRANLISKGFLVDSAWPVIKKHPDSLMISRLLNCLNSGG